MIFVMSKCSIYRIIWDFYSTYACICILIDFVYCKRTGTEKDIFGSFLFCVNFCFITECKLLN